MTPHHCAAAGEIGFTWGIYCLTAKMQPQPDHDDSEKLVIKIASNEFNREEATQALRKLIF